MRPHMAVPPGMPPLPGRGGTRPRPVPGSVRSRTPAGQLVPAQHDPSQQRLGMEEATLGCAGRWEAVPLAVGSAVAAHSPTSVPPASLATGVSEARSPLAQGDTAEPGLESHRRCNDGGGAGDSEFSAPVLLGSKGFDHKDGPQGTVASQSDAADNVLISDDPVTDAAEIDTSDLEATLSAAAAVRGRQFKWVRGEVIGRGTMGNVFRALDQETGVVFAAKEILINKFHDKDNKLRRYVENEINILRRLEHPNIVRYLGHDCIGDALYVYMEYMPGGSIQTVLSQFGPFDESLIAVYTRALLGGLEYLHTREPPVVHRDIKGANVLVGANCDVKLSDFGCSKREVETMTNQMRGSIPWMAPEVIQSTGYGRAADIWSFGCVIIEMASAKPPWGKFDNPIAALRIIGMGDGLPPVPDTMSPICKDFIGMCVARDQHARLTATELRTHAFLEIGSDFD